MLMRPCVRYRRISANLIAARPHAVSLVITRDNVNSGLYSAAIGAANASEVRMRARVPAVSGRFIFISLSLSQLKLSAVGLSPRQSPDDAGGDPRRSVPVSRREAKAEPLRQEHRHLAT